MHEVEYLYVNPVRYLIMPLSVMFLCTGLLIYPAKDRRVTIFSWLAVASPFLLVPAWPFGPFLSSVPELAGPMVFVALALTSAWMLREFRFPIYFIVLAVAKSSVVFAFFELCCLWAIYRALRVWWLASSEMTSEWVSGTNQTRSLKEES